MGREIRDYERPPRDGGATAVAMPPRHFNPILIIGIALWGMAAFYAALVVASQLDETFFPGNEFSIGIKIPGVDAPQDEPTMEGRINILVMGLDLRRDEDPETPSRTDTVFILSMEPVTKTAGILSIPRDLLVDIPDGEGGYIPDRINTAYERGELREEGSGPDVAMETVEHNFGIPIDNYAILNFNNFIEIVDELGGIDVDVPEYVSDWAYNDCLYCPYYGVEFVPGVEHMDGERALAYARLRKTDNDFKRIERQQIVMKAIARKASDLGVLLGSNPKNLYDQYKGSVKTNISDLKIPGLALLGRQIGVDNIRMESLADATYPCPASLCGGAAMLLADQAKLEEIKNRIFGDVRLQAEAAVIKIMNGTETPDLAAKFGRYLESQGIPEEKIIIDEQAGGNFYDTTLVVNFNEKDLTGGQLAEWLSLAKTRIKTPSELTATQLQQFEDTTADVVVVLGSDVILPDIPTPTYYDPGYNDYYDPGTDTGDDYIPEDT
ncbi:MAG TPA: LCP family protein, partial [Dehalococcoidia bacterium]|nr:LCP family protein [Dehalococcoidia bacterium]